MVTIDLMNGDVPLNQQDNQPSSYPDEVLDAGWNPEILQMPALNPVTERETEKPRLPPSVIYQQQPEPGHG